MDFMLSFEVIILNERYKMFVGLYRTIACLIQSNLMHFGKCASGFKPQR